MVANGLAKLIVLAAIALFTQGAGAADPEAGVDPAVEPGDDFFGWANGAWLAATPVPPGTARVTARSQIAQQTRQQVAQLLREASAEDSAPAARQVAAYRMAWADEARIEGRGLAPLRPLLEGIHRLHDKTALARWLGRHLPADTDPQDVGVHQSRHLFGLAVVSGIHGETQRFACLVQGGLGLGTRDAYFDDSAAGVALRERWQGHLARLLQAAGFDHATRRAEAVLALETEIARHHAGSQASADERNADRRWRRADFGRRAPGLDWPAFFGAAGLARQDGIVVWQPEALVASAALVASQPLALWQDYLRAHLLHRFAEVLPAAFAQPAAEWQATHEAAASRAERALAATETALPEAVAPLYVARHFPPPVRAQAQRIFDHVAATFARRVATVPWLEPTSRQVALAKLAQVRFHIGHPDRWPEDAALRMAPDDAFGNLQRVDEGRRRRALARLARPLDRGEWALSPQSPQALLMFQTNTYDFAAALLQPPKFDPAASEAAQYGAAGAIFGHELSHFVDTLGAEYDEHGALRAWWTAADRAAYALAAQPLAAQYAAYRPLPGLALEGQALLTEAVADLAGLSAAFEACRGALGAQAVDAAALRRLDREFFIGFARAWRAQTGEAALRAQVAADPQHAPERWRVATVRNLDAWAEAFDVQPRHRLYLPPTERVRVW